MSSSSGSTTALSKAVNTAQIGWKKGCMVSRHFRQESAKSKCTVLVLSSNNQKSHWEDYSHKVQSTKGCLLTWASTKVTPHIHVWQRIVMRGGDRPVMTTCHPVTVRPTEGDFLANSTEFDNIDACSQLPYFRSSISQQPPRFMKIPLIRLEESNRSKLEEGLLPKQVFKWFPLSASLFLTTTLPSSFNCTEMCVSTCVRMTTTYRTWFKMLGARSVLDLFYFFRILKYLHMCNGMSSRWDPSLNMKFLCFIYALFI